MTPAEVIILGVVALVVMGPRNLPAVLRGAGRILGAARARFGDDGLRGIALVAMAMLFVVATLAVRR